MIAAPLIKTAARSDADVAAHAGNAARAAATAASACSTPASAAWPTTRELWLGFTESSTREPGVDRLAADRQRIAAAKLAPGLPRVRWRMAARFSGRAKSVGGSL